MRNKIGSALTSKKNVIVLITILSLFISATGYFYYKKEESLTRQQKYNVLKAIADLKESQINQWLNQKTAEVKVIARSPFFSEGIYHWLQDTGNVQLKNNIIERLQPIQKEFGYENIFIASPNGHLLLSAKTGLEEVDTLTKQKITEASIKKEIAFSDFYFCQKENKIHYDIIVPIISNENKTIAILLFRIDPNDYIFPLIETWPTPSKSAETALLRVENKNVLVLNELRHRKNTALKLRIPLTRTEVPAVQAALGRTGFFEGIDYRGIEVLSYVRKIPVSNWIIVSKVDKSEIYADVYLTVGVISGFSIFLIIICGVGFAFIYSSRQKNIFLELYNKEKELWQHQEKFKVTMDSLGEGVITTDFNGKIQYVNKIAEELTGWNFREARGRMLSEVYSVKNEETGQKESNILEKVVKQGIVKELANHTILISKSGKEIPVMDTGSPIYDNDGSIIGIVIAFQDETEKRRQLKLIKESEFRLRSTLDNMMEGCQIIGFDYKYLFLNKTALIQAKLRKEELLGKTMNECYPGIENTKMFSEVRRCMEERVSASMDNEFSYPDGKKGWFELSIQAIPEGIFILSQDITARKQAEQGLIIANKELLFQNEEKEKRAAELNENKTMLESILDSSLSGIMAFNSIRDAEGAIVDFAWQLVNCTAERMVGRSHAELVGKRLLEEMPGNRAEGLFDLYVQVVETGIPLSHEHYYEHEQVKTWFHTIAIKRLDGFVVTFSNITERKLAEEKIRESDERFNRLVSALNDVVWTASHDGSELIDVNNSFENIYGISIEEFKSNPALWIEMVHSEDRTIAEASGKELFEKGNSQAEYRIVKPDGTLVWLWDRKSLIYDENGKVVQMGGIAKDITIRKQAEQEIINARDKAEEMNRVKSNFLANMSHELRTPLIGIIGFADFLRDELENPELKEMAENVYSSGNRLNETVNLILDLSKFEADKMDFCCKKIDLVKETEETISFFERLALPKGLYIKSSFSQPSLFMNTDERSIRSILNNLINNAIKFTNEGGVTIDISLKDNFVEIKVIDTGIGIAEKYHEIIFEEFRQVSEGITRNFEGAGLGLSITKKVVAKLGGKISIESGADKGSTFIVKLPVINAEERTGEYTVIENISLPIITGQKAIKPIALLVDDDPFVYVMLKRYLNGQVDLESIPDGEFAVKLCMQKQFDFIFMDINLRRGMDGIQVTQAIRKIEGYENIPIIANTAYAMVGDKEDFLAAGCSHYLSKPFSQRDVLNLLEEILMKDV